MKTRISLSPVLLLTTALLAGCSEQGAPTDPAEIAPLFAKPGGGGGGGSTDTDPTAAYYLPTSAGTLGLRLLGDGLFADLDGFSGTSRYQEYDCGVHSKIFLGGSGDAIMHTDNTRYKDRKCAEWPRKIHLDLKRLTGSGPEGPLATETFINTFNIQNSTTILGIGETVQRPLHIGIHSGTGSACATLRFREVTNDGTVMGADLVNVTRIDARTWRVWTPADVTNSDDYVTHHDEAACVDSNGNVLGFYHLPVDYHIVADRDLPLPTS